MNLHPIQPERWKDPRGYSNAIRVDGAQTLLFVAGQIAWDADQNLVGRGDFAAQFRQALANVVALVEAGGGRPEHVTLLTIYVTDKAAYLAASKTIGVAYRELMGHHYPAMALVQVADLLEDGALVEIQATAAMG